jgi:hypothetical protein
MTARHEPDTPPWISATDALAINLADAVRRLTTRERAGLLATWLEGIDPNRSTVGVPGTLALFRRLVVQAQRDDEAALAAAGRAVDAEPEDGWSAGQPETGAPDHVSLIDGEDGTPLAGPGA